MLSAADRADIRRTTQESVPSALAGGADVPPQALPVPHRAADRVVAVRRYPDASLPPGSVPAIPGRHREPTPAPPPTHQSTDSLRHPVASAQAAPARAREVTENHP